MGILGEQVADKHGVGNFKQISYFQKIRIIDYILEQERELQVEESSWRHCLLYLLLNGAITEGEFASQFHMEVQSQPRYKQLKQEKK